MTEVSYTVLLPNNIMPPLKIDAISSEDAAKKFVKDSIFEQLNPSISPYPGNAAQPELRLLELYDHFFIVYKIEDENNKYEECTKFNLKDFQINVELNL